MQFDIDISDREEGEKEVSYDLYFNKEKIVMKSSLSIVVEKIKTLVSAIAEEPKEKKK